MLVVRAVVQQVVQNLRALVLYLCAPRSPTPCVRVTKTGCVKSNSHRKFPASLCGRRLRGRLHTKRRCNGRTASMMSVVPLLSAAFTLMCLRIFGSSSMSCGPTFPIPTPTHRTRVSRAPAVWLRISTPQGSASAGVHRVVLARRARFPGGHTHTRELPKEGQTEHSWGAVTHPDETSLPVSDRPV